MGLTILEVLQDKEPQGRSIQVMNSSLKVMYDLVRKHMGEIEEARARGYSWGQINEACRESWQKHSDVAANIVWWKKTNFIASCYKAVKNGTTAGKAKPKKKRKPLSLKVTVEKR